MEVKTRYLGKAFNDGHAIILFTYCDLLKIYLISEERSFQIPPDHAAGEITEIPLFWPSLVYIGWAIPPEANRIHNIVHSFDLRCLALRHTSRWFIHNIWLCLFKEMMMVIIIIIIIIITTVMIIIYTVSMKSSNSYNYSDFYVPSELEKSYE